MAQSWDEGIGVPSLGRCINPGCIVGLIGCFGGLPGFLFTGVFFLGCARGFLFRLLSFALSPFKIVIWLFCHDHSKRFSRSAWPKDLAVRPGHNIWPFGPIRPRAQGTGPNRRLGKGGRAVLSSELSEVCQSTSLRFSAEDLPFFPSSRS